MQDAVQGDSLRHVDAQSLLFFIEVHPFNGQKLAGLHLDAHYLPRFLNNFLYFVLFYPVKIDLSHEKPILISLASNVFAVHLEELLDIFVRRLASFRKESVNFP